jgi:protein-S-isoprenylcysteine O-methyltransferase Ste14
VKAGPRAEKEMSQKLIQLLVGGALVASGFLAVFIVYKENTFTSATIEVAPNQRIISTGPYAVVRHPMYAGALAMLFATPLALGSWTGLVMFILMFLVIVLRLLEEEKFLQRTLQGYTEYRERVRFRLVPYIW